MARGHTDCRSSPQRSPRRARGAVSLRRRRLFPTFARCSSRGRGFEARDDSASSPPVVVINETMAHAVWPGESASGSSFSPGRGFGPLGGRFTDERTRGHRRRARHQEYVAARRAPSRRSTIRATVSDSATMHMSSADAATSHLVPLACVREENPIRPRPWAARARDQDVGSRASARRSIRRGS